MRVFKRTNSGTDRNNKEAYRADYCSNINFSVEQAECKNSTKDSANRRDNRLKNRLFHFFFSFPLLCLYYSMELVVCQVFFPFLIVKFLTSMRPGAFVNCLTSKNAKIVWKIIPDYLLFPKFRDGFQAEFQARGQKSVHSLARCIL